jgi:hypothetical protein
MWFLKETESTRIKLVFDPLINRHDPELLLQQSVNLEDSINILYPSQEKEITPFVKRENSQWWTYALEEPQVDITSEFWLETLKIYDVDVGSSSLW